MSKTILLETSGFTPLIDDLVHDTDMETAAVFGVMWRYCQMKDGECYSSLQKIANRLNLSYKTVQRRVRTLVAKGYLQDITPHLRYSPHTYRDTGKAAVRSSVIAGVDDGILDQAHPHTAYESPDMVETLTEVAENLDAKGELNIKRWNLLEKKVNPDPTPKRKTNWNEEVTKLKEGRSESPLG